ncbi:MAG: hypothetical protein ACFE95_13930 [Candidatus Hodarchaeota archaeon]
MKILFSCLVIVNLAIITSLFFVFCISPSLVSSTSEKNIINQKITTNFSEANILNHGIPLKGIFNESSKSHTYIFETINQGQVIYFSINPNSDFNITLYNPYGIKFDIKRTFHPNEGIYLGSWQASLAGDWLLEVNNTRAENVTYDILASIPETGYSGDSSVFLKQSFLEANFTLDHEIHYWKVSLEANQNGTLFLNEVTQSVLFQATLTIYPQKTPNNPILPSKELTQSDLPDYNFSWNSFVTDYYIIEIEHKAQDATLTGIYNISFITEEDLFSVETAGKLPYNKTISIRVNPPGYSTPKKYFFWFQVNSSRSKVNIRVSDEGTDLLEIYGQVEIFDSGHQNPLYSNFEQSQVRDGEFNITETLNEGIYYLVITPTPGAIGELTIHFDYQLPQPFTFELASIFVSMCLLMALPAYLIYLDSKGKWYQIDQWTIPNSLEETYKLFKYSFRGIFNIKEVPQESILIQVASIPFRTYSLINFIESSEIETIVFSKRIRRKIEWVIYVLIGFICFDFLNIFSYVLYTIHFLPFYVANLTSLIFVLAIPTVLLVITVLFVNVSSYLTYKQIINRIIYVIQNYEESLDSEIPIERLDSAQAIKSINYVRVLWNQAKHAFKEKNYELFVIKADASVKNLLSTRFLQVVAGDTHSKPDFQIQVTELRRRGFDLPSDRKIAHFRNLRNRIVHSSVTLDEKESVDCFAYYSTFITRLGLRPS